MFPPPHQPGQTPLDDISGLKLKGIATTAALNNAEAENIRRATVKYLVARPSRRAAPFDVRWCFRLHKEMFGNVWAWAGVPRQTDGFNIGARSHTIETEMHNLLENLRAWADSDMPLFEQAVRLHHGAVRIHPFRSGNGRWSRMLGNIWLKLHAAPLPEWPEQVLGTESPVRAEYLAAVRSADKGDFGPLLALHSRFTARTAS